MNKFIETMAVLQRNFPSPARRTAGVTKIISELRARVPAPVLAHFDRQLARGCKGVAEVHRGVCGGCHLRLPTSVSAHVSEDSDVPLCANCGAYLMFPDEETTATSLTRKTCVAAAMA